MGVVSLVAGVIFSVALLVIYGGGVVVLLALACPVLPIIYLFGVQKNLKANKEKFE